MSGDNGREKKHTTDIIESIRKLRVENLNIFKVYGNNKEIDSDSKEEDLRAKEKCQIAIENYRKDREYTEAADDFKYLYHYEDASIEEKENYFRINTESHVYKGVAQFLSGAIAGGIATFGTHWLDTVKVRMQTFPRKYMTNYECFLRVLKKEGVKGLYKGASPAVTGAMMKAAIVFSSYGFNKDLVRLYAGLSPSDELTVLELGTAGAMTGVTTSLFLCPVEMIKVRSQVLTKSKNRKRRRPTTPRAILKDVFRKEGIRGLYRGLLGMWFKDIPGSFIYFGSYEGAKSVMRLFTNKHNLDSPYVFVCGVFAGLCFTITHPVESVKTRVQVLSALSDKSKPPTLMKYLIHVLKIEGLGPLFSGLPSQMLRSSMYSGIQFMIFEGLKRIMYNINQHKFV